MILKVILLALSVLPACLECAAQTVTFSINLQNKVQTIENFGAAGAWFTEVIGKHWPLEKKERTAELLFSKAFDKSGHPLGIGLSAWRFNIGGGTAEQGDSSGISNPLKRVEGFLSPDGTYQWNKQPGYLWFVKKAASYGVEDLIAFSNTPPVHFNKNGLGFKTEKDYQANLKEDKYDDFASFLATTLEHFEKEGLHFKYVCPVNEPQWDWSNKFGQMNQEGSPWHNKDIYKITAKLDSALTSKKLSTRIIITESGNLTSLYEGNGHASSQIQNFYSPASPFFVGRLKNVHHVIAGHSYFTDTGDTNIIRVREKVRDTAAKYNVPFWQSEYCMLGNGYKEGLRGRIPAIDCALFLSKIIYHDLTAGNATAWQFWNAWEPGSAEFDTRYYLVALKNPLAADADFTATKNLWALGHYSRFVRPGMQRLQTGRSDGLDSYQAAKDVMLVAFRNEKQVVVVVTNYTGLAKDIAVSINGSKGVKSAKQYVTTAAPDVNMTPYAVPSLHSINLQPRSITTIVIELK